MKKMILKNGRKNCSKTVDLKQKKNFSFRCRPEKYKDFQSKGTSADQLRNCSKIFSLRFSQSKSSSKLLEKQYPRSVDWISLTSAKIGVMKYETNQKKTLSFAEIPQNSHTFATCTKHHLNIPNNPPKQPHRTETTTHPTKTRPLLGDPLKCCERLNLSST